MGIGFVGRKIWLGATALLASGAIALGVMGGSAEAADEGRVRIMHASPDTPAVDIFVDGAKAVTALAFPKDTGYVTLPAGTHNVKVFVSPSDGTGSPALEANLDIAAGADYTVLAVGEVGAGTLELLPLVDNNASPAAGNAHVRLIHASPDAPAVNVAVAGTSTNLFENVPFKGVGTYTPVPTGTYDLEVKVSASGDTVLPINGLALADRTVYTVVAVGLAGDASLTVIPLVDVQHSAPGAPTTGTGLASADGGFAPWMLAAGILMGLGALGLAGIPAISRISRK
jgi:hypothetical protein